MKTTCKFLRVIAIMAIFIGQTYCTQSFIVPFACICVIMLYCILDLYRIGMDIINDRP